MNMIARWNHGNGLIPVTLRGVDDLFRAVLDRMSTDFSPELMFDNGNSPRLELEVGKEAVTASLPIAGCRPEDIDIEVVGDNLTIRATRMKMRTISGANAPMRSTRRASNFRCASRAAKPKRSTLTAF